MAVQEPKGANRYVIGRYLGYGSTSEVFESIDLVAKRKVAIKKKMPAPEYEEIDVGDETFLQEAEILSKLNHPNIIKLLDTYVHDDKHHLVLELMETSLEGKFYDQCISLSPADCKAYMQMLLQGLAYLHQNFIKHGDVKLDNILFGPDGTLKLADFGQACYFENGPAHYFEADILRLRDIVEVLLVAESKLPSHATAKEFKNCTVESLSKLFPEASEDFLELYEQMFLHGKMSAQQALQHRYFTSAPLPTPAHLLPRKAFPASTSPTSVES